MGYLRVLYGCGGGWEFTHRQQNRFSNNNKKFEPFNSVPELLLCTEYRQTGGTARFPLVVLVPKRKPITNTCRLWLISLNCHSIIPPVYGVRTCGSKFSQTLVLQSPTHIPIHWRQVHRLHYTIQRWTKARTLGRIFLPVFRIVRSYDPFEFNEGKWGPRMKQNGYWRTFRRRSRSGLWEDNNNDCSRTNCYNST